MRHVSDTQQPQGIVAVFPLPTPDLPQQPERVILDAIRDPANMGTMLRTAAAANVQAVLLSPDCVDLYNPKTLPWRYGRAFSHSNWREKLGRYQDVLPGL
jgi:TrmH family RNA methyltransferase